MRCLPTEVGNSRRRQPTKTARVSRRQARAVFAGVAVSCVPPGRRDLAVPYGDEMGEGRGIKGVCFGEHCVENRPDTIETDVAPTT